MAPGRLRMAGSSGGRGPVRSQSTGCGWSPNVSRDSGERVIGSGSPSVFLVPERGRGSAMKRWLAVAAAAAAVGLGVPAWVAPASAGGAPYCGIRWGSLPKDAGVLSRAHLAGVRAGQHACFDRLVLDFDARARGYSVRYVAQVTEDGSGRTV